MGWEAFRFQVSLSLGREEREPFLRSQLPSGGSSLILQVFLGRTSFPALEKRILQEGKNLSTNVFKEGESPPLPKGESVREGRILFKYFQLQVPLQLPCYDFTSIMVSSLGWGSPSFPFLLQEEGKGFSPNSQEDLTFKV